MFKPIYDKLEKEVSGEIAFNFLSEITRHHRIQASPGFRDAVNYTSDILKKHGLDTQIDSYPADGRSYSWSSLHFKEWNCNDAELKIVKPEEEVGFIARWSEAKLSLIQRSHPTPEEGVEAEIVVLDKGEEEKDYTELEVRGKIVLTNGDVGRVHELAIERHGALGIIYDGTWVRPPALLEGELDDALKYTSFWWAGDEQPAFGFVLTPRRGRWLRKLVEDNEKKGQPVKVHARVDSNIYEGSIENAVAFIPGETEEEVVIVAHICHPQPSANDNASGTATAMEAARALRKLIDEGVLQKPKRSIRFSFVPEMAGTYNFLASKGTELSNIVAALNLDMVGEKQELTAGPLIVEMTPEASPSYVNSLMEAIFEEVKGEAKNLGGSSSYALFKHAVTPFSGGSDHYIYSDPSVGIACPMVIQWPDKFWHTSYDTLDKVDPNMLRRVALMTATYAYFIASSDQVEAVWLASETASRERSRITSQIQKFVTDTLADAEENEKASETLEKALKKLRKIIAYRLDRAVRAVKSVQRLAPGTSTYSSTEEKLIKGLENMAKYEKESAENTFIEYAKTKNLEIIDSGERKLGTLEEEAQHIVPNRVYPGPVSIRPWLRRLSATDRDEWYAFSKKYEKVGRVQGTLALYWTDGKRSLLEISELVELEAGSVNLEYIKEYYEWLKKLELITF